jgi:hypothetical protein
MLELFRKRAKRTTTGDLLKHFSSNKFCLPAAFDAIGIKELELQWLKFARGNKFTIIALSPLTALGTASALAPVDQNKVVSAIRAPK